MIIKIIGGGLAGCEAAYYLAKLGFEVELHDIKPNGFTPAHSNKNLGELVCSNSLKSSDAYGNACGLLKREMTYFDSLMMFAASACSVPAGNALAVDRDKFAQLYTEVIDGFPNITRVCGEVTKIPEENAIIATGPLTTSALYGDIERYTGGCMHFYDASAPIISRESIDFNYCFKGDRYGKGGDDYINCPLGRERYYAF